MNVIVFVLRGCPAAWLGAYGNEWVATPNLDRFAAEAVVFDRHISDEPTAEAANRAWSPHGAALVRANHPETDSPPSFYAGCGEVFDARPREGDPSPLDHLLRELPAILDRVGNEKTIWIDIDRLLPPWVVSREVFEAYVTDEEEVEDAVEPLADPELGPFDTNDDAAWQWLHSSFAAVVTALDAELGAAFELLRERGWDRTATWIVTSDFGLPLGEHGIVGPDGSELHEELVHVPLIVRKPNAEDAGRRVGEFTQPASLNAPPFAKFPGEEAHTRLQGAAAIRTREWALIVPADSEKKPMLFTKPDDRGEVHDVAAQFEETAATLLARSTSRASPSPSPPTSEGPPSPTR